MITTTIIFIIISIITALIILYKLIVEQNGSIGIIRYVLILYFIVELIVWVLPLRAIIIRGEIMLPETLSTFFWMATAKVISKIVFLGYLFSKTLK